MQKQPQEPCQPYPRSTHSKANDLAYLAFLSFKSLHWNRNSTGVALLFWDRLQSIRRIRRRVIPRIEHGVKYYVIRRLPETVTNNW